MAKLITSGLTFLTLVSDIFLATAPLALLFGKFIPKIRKPVRYFFSVIKPYARISALAVALAATLGSLFYSEILKYSPCLLCWYQRILMYPQVLLLSAGIIKNDKNAADYSLALSIPGAGIALYHYYLQLGGGSILPCSTVGISADCAQKFSLEYGYITIPMMSLSAFLLLIFLMIIYKYYKS